MGLVVLIMSDVVLAHGSHWPLVLLGVALWGLHMGLTQGLLATMVAQVAPPELKGTAFGFFNVTSGLATLVASLVAGELWDRFGAGTTFYAGAGFCIATLIALVARTTTSGGKA
jgi:MFS family permease